MSDSSEVTRQISASSRLRAQVAREDVEEMRVRLSRTRFGRRLRVVRAVLVTLLTATLAADAWFAYEVFFRS